MHAEQSGPAARRPHCDVQTGTEDGRGDAQRDKHDVGAGRNRPQHGDDERNRYQSTEHAEQKHAARGDRIERPLPRGTHSPRDPQTPQEGNDAEGHEERPKGSGCPDDGKSCCHERCEGSREQYRIPLDDLHADD